MAKSPNKREVTLQFRDAMRNAHPDHGGDHVDAARAMSDIAEARRILTSKQR